MIRRRPEHGCNTGAEFTGARLDLREHQAEPLPNVWTSSGLASPVAGRRTATMDDDFDEPAEHADPLEIGLTLAVLEEPPDVLRSALVRVGQRSGGRLARRRRGVAVGA